MHIAVLTSEDGKGKENIIQPPGVPCTVQFLCPLGGRESIGVAVTAWMLLPVLLTLTTSTTASQVRPPL